MRFCFSGTAGRFLAVVVFLSLASGCGSGSFLGTRYDNFTAYYNTFYNAQRSYRAGVENRERVDEKVDRTKYIGVFIEAGNSTGGARDFEEAVLKSANVLREHQDSKWVDDALLLIGKSYFYQNNYVGAQQKFQEAIAQDTGLEDEARFWLARTLVASGDFKGAEDVITEALTGNVRDRKWESALRLVLGELRVKQADWESAATELAAGLEHVYDKDIAARAQFLLGQVLEKLERYPEAVRAYRKTREFRPRYELDYAAQLSSIRVEGEHVNAQDALKRLRKMERDDKHFSTRAELAVLRGEILKSMGLANEAYNVFDELLYDPAYSQQITNLRGRIHYALAELYRDLDEDFVLAAAHFDTAASLLRTPASVRPGSGSGPVDPNTLSPEAIKNASELKESFAVYATAFREADRLDSLLWLGRMDDSTFAAKVLQLRRLRAEELAERQRQQAAREVARAFQQAAAAPLPAGSRGLPEGKVIPNYNSPGGQSGFLFHDDPVMKQEGLLSFARKWGDRPLVPNWRRLDAVRGIDPAEVEALQEEEDDVVLADDQLPEIDISGVPRDSLAQADMKVLQASARYDVGTALFLGIERPDSAAVWYRMVIDETPELPVARRALFALAEVQRALGDSLSANRIYQRMVAEYPDTEFATRIRKLLGMQTAEQVPDSLAQAESAYEGAFKDWQEHQYQSALDGMFETAGRFAGTAVEPKALLAASSVFMEWARRDTLDLFGPIPTGVPDSLLVRTGLITPPARSEPADSLSAGADSLAVTPPSGALSSDSTRAARPPIPAASDSTRAARPPIPAAPDSARAARPPIPTAADSAGAARRQIPEGSDPTGVQIQVLADSVEAASPDSMATVTGGSVDAAAAAGRLGLPADRAVSADSARTLAAGEPVRRPTGTDSTGAIASGAVPRGPVSGAANLAQTLPAVEEAVEETRPWNEIRLEALLKHVSTHYAGTSYATRAGRTLTAVEAMIAEEAAYADSVRKAEARKQADSLAVIAAASDSLRALARADSLARTPRTDALVQTPAPPAGIQRVDSLAATAGEIPAQTPKADSLAQTGQKRTDALANSNRGVTPPAQLPGAAGRDSLAAVTDSLAAATPAPDSLTVQPTEKQPVTPTETRPAATRTDSLRTPIGMAGARNAVADLNKPMEVFESNGLEPLQQSEEEAVWHGWTLVLAEFKELSQATVARQNLENVFGAVGVPEIWSGSWKNTSGFLVTLGRVATRDEAQALADLLGVRRPADAWLLHITP